MSKISYFLPGKSWTDLYISMFAKTHKLRIYASSLHVFWIVSRILAAKPPINSGEKLTVDVDVFKAPCFARQEIHRKNPPICPSETQEIHRNPRSLLEFYHVFNHVLPEYHQFLLFFSTCLNIFLEQKFPSISPPLLWWCFPIFVHRFSLRKSIFSPFFHHFSRKSPKKCWKIPAKISGRSFAAAQSAWPPWAGSSPGGWPPAAWSPSPGSVRARWWPGGDSYFIWLMMVNDG